jgi:hypothetical protein
MDSDAEMTALEKSSHLCGLLAPKFRRLQASGRLALLPCFSSFPLAIVDRWLGISRVVNGRNGLKLGIASRPGTQLSFRDSMDRDLQPRGRDNIKHLDVKSDMDTH